MDMIFTKSDFSAVGVGVQESVQSPANYIMLINPAWKNCAWTTYMLCQQELNWYFSSLS